jgi:acyl-CoA synthetase (AMP-forming)/AMP-acid ligase II
MSADLRRALERDLSDPMVPSAFVFLEALPLTPHGKVDRRSLQAPTAPGLKRSHISSRRALLWKKRLEEMS